MTDSIERMPTHPRSTIESDKAILKKEVESAKKSGNLLKWLSDFFKSNEKVTSKIPFVGALIGLINLIIKYQEISEGKPDTESRLEALAGTIETDEGEPEVTDSELEEMMKEVKPLEEYNHTEIESAPFERGKPSEKYPKGVTLCSKTAYLNLMQLGGFAPRDFFDAKKALKEGNSPVGIPRGDAHDVMDYYMMASVEKYVGTPNKVIIDKLAGCSEDLVDLVVKSSSVKWEHRAAAFRSSDGNWYVLDPYQRGATTKAIPIEDYKGNIKIAVPLSRLI